MEGYNRDMDSDRFEGNRYSDRNRRRADEDSYRGAYRFDTSSDHRNVSTWDWSNDQERNRRENDYNQNYNRDYNRNYNRDYNQDYNRYDRDSTSRNRGYDHDNYNADSRYYRDQDSRYRSSNSSNWDEQYRPTSGGYGTRFGGDTDREHRSVHDRIEHRDRGALSSFNAHYGPDHYGQGGGANYGNEAGSLSYGYDGSSNYDPDWNRQYNPLTGRLSGQRRSYHGNYTSRHPERGASRTPYEDQR